MNALKRILNSISKDKKRFAVLTALVILALAIPVLVLLICLSLVTEDEPPPEVPPPPPPIVQVVAAPAFMSVAEERLVPALEKRLGDTADISLVSPDKEQKDCDLTLIFGSADTSPAYRYSLYSELGIDGYSVSLTDESTAVARFLSASGAISAADALSESVAAGEKPTFTESCEKTEVLRGEGADVQRTVTVADEDFSVICLSAPSVDTHTVNAISALVDAADADLVVFNGDLDCGATSRAELASAWKAISDILALRSASFIFTLSGSEALPDVMLCEVISSMDNCIGGGGVYTVCREGGEPLTAIIASSHGENGATDGVVAAIAELTPFWKSSAGKKFPLLAVFPDAPEGLSRTATALSARGTPTPDVSPSTAAVLNAALTAGADHLICGGSKNSYGVAEKLLDTLPDGYTAALSPRMALCGAIGYTEEGLGGRFELHNSLRGGVSFVASDDSCAFSYLFAAKYTAKQE